MTGSMLQAVGKPYRVLRLAIVESPFVHAAERRHITFVAHRSLSGKCVFQLCEDGSDDRAIVIVFCQPPEPHGAPAQPT